jgi:hypothetical protein
MATRAIIRNANYRKARYAQERGLISPLKDIFTYNRCSKPDATWALNFNIALSPNTYQSGAIAFSLEDATGYSEFLTLYDFFRITWVEFHILCTQTMSEDAAGGILGVNEANNVFLHTAVDTNDSATVTPANLRQYETYKISRITDLNGKNHVFGFAPKLQQLYSDAYMGESNPKAWVNCTSSAVQWHGIKWALERPAGSRPQLDMKFMCYLKMTIQFKVVH